MRAPNTPVEVIFWSSQKVFMAPNSPSSWHDCRHNCEFEVFHFIPCFGIWGGGGAGIVYNSWMLRTHSIRQN